ncbi:MAG TPA: RidA family protein [Limnochordia bacterium]|nr:RidA family protein [Limnochordia bacterium]
MPSPEERLKELGIELPKPPKPLAAYVPAVRAGDLVFISGQAPMRDGKPVYTGRVGADLTLEEGYEAARLVMINALAVLKEEIGSLDNVERIVKVLGWVNSAPDFTQQPQVINGASELLEQVFGERGKHARSAVSAHTLPFNIAVEIEMIVQVK